MNEKGFTGVFLSALIIGAVATFSVYKLVVEQRVITVGTNDHMVPVVVAVEDMTEGSPLNETNVRVKRVNADAAPPNSFASMDSLLGRVTQLPLFAGEPVIEAKLAPIGSSAGLEVKIAPGKRAMAIPVNDHIAINGFIQPNSRVDVLVTLRSKGSMTDQKAKVFLQNMRVLSVGQHLRRGDDGKPITASTVALEVSPEEAELLAVAMNEGVLSLALRGYADEDSVNTGGADAQSVLAAMRKFEPRPSRPRPRPQAAAPAPVVEEEQPAWTKVQIFRGSEMTERTVETKDSTKAGTTKASPNGNGGL